MRPTWIFQRIGGGGIEETEHKVGRASFWSYTLLFFLKYNTLEFFFPLLVFFETGSGGSKEGLS